MFTESFSVFLPSFLVFVGFYSWFVNMGRSLLGTCMLSLFLQAVNGDFTADMSRKADDWVPVAQCRAYCLDMFGKYFGETTSVDCTTKSMECFRCWNDCACLYFKPKPLWEVCSPRDRCNLYAGCRRARDHSERSKGFVYTNQSSQNVSSWTVSGRAELTGDKMNVVTVLQHPGGSVYSAVPHLVFSLSYKKNDSWLQLTQEVRFGFSLNIGDGLAAECHEGCDLRVVVTNDSAVLADTSFPYLAPRKFSLQAALDRGSGSPLSVKLAWKPFPSEIPDKSVTLLTWRRVPRPDTNQIVGVNDSGSTVVPFSATNLTDASFMLPHLKYNSTYSILVAYNTTKYAVSYEVGNLKTPDCADPDPTLMHCADKETAAPLQQPQRDVTVLVLVPLAVVIVAVMAAGCLVWYRRRQRDDNSFTRSASQSPLSRNEVYQATDCPGERVPLGLREECLKNRSVLHRGEFITTAAAFSHDAVAWKRADGRPGRESREVRLRVEYEILNMLPSHQNFVKLYGHVENPPHGILTVFEATSSPLDVMLRSYRTTYEQEVRFSRIYLNGIGKSATGIPDKMEAQWMAFSPRQLFALAEQVAQGVAYLNSRGLVHGALCANNVLCDTKFQARIHGLSNASRLEQSKKHLFANVEKYSRWLPPEILSYGKFAVSSKTDVWSFGIFLWELVTLGCIPYPYHTADVKTIRIRLAGKSVLDQPPTCGNLLYQFMLACWNLEPKDRPHMAEVYHMIEESAKKPDAHSQIMFARIPDLKNMDDTPNEDNRDLPSTTSNSVFEADSMEDDVFEPGTDRSDRSAVEPVYAEPVYGSLTDSIRNGFHRGMCALGAGSYASSYSNM